MGRILSRCLLVVLVMVGGCSSVETSGSGGTGGAQTIGAGGVGAGTAGTGGQEPSRCTTEPVSCIASCALDRNSVAAAICDESTGIWRCASGLVDHSTCPAGSCAALYRHCCNFTTGQDQYAACTPEGLRDDCPADMRESKLGCIPDDLGVSDCGTLSKMACGTVGQQCSSGVAHCECLRGDAGSSWACTFLLI